MNIGIDKDDLFRHAAPGYVFILVILSFYTLIGRLSEIDSVVKGILTVVVGFPLGFIFHHIYRFFHVAMCFSFSSSHWFPWWPVCGSEQNRMELMEARLILRKLKDKSRSLELGRTSRRRDLSQLFELFLCLPENKVFRDRGHVLIMRVHALSGSIVAIIIALGAIVFKSSEWNLLPRRSFFSLNWPLSDLAYGLGWIWLCVAAVFWVVRQRANGAFQLLMRRIIINFWPKFDRFIKQ